MSDVLQMLKGFNAKYITLSAGYTLQLVQSRTLHPRLLHYNTHPPSSPQPEGRPEGLGLKHSPHTACKPPPAMKLLSCQTKKIVHIIAHCWRAQKAPGWQRSRQHRHRRDGSSPTPTLARAGQSAPPQRPGSSMAGRPQSPLRGQTTLTAACGAGCTRGPQSQPAAQPPRQPHPRLPPAAASWRRTPTKKHRFRQAPSQPSVPLGEGWGGGLDGLGGQQRVRPGH